MKRIFFVLISLVALSSCLKDDGSGMGQKYQLVTTFQYEGIKFNADSTFVNTSETIGFGYDALNFFHNLGPDNITLEGGFILSRLEMPKSGNTAGLKNRYRALLPKEASPGNIYTVFYQNQDPAKMPTHNVEFAFDENGTCSMKGCYVTNTVEVADYVRENFEEGDMLVLKATGYFKGVETAAVEMNLADYSSQKDSIVSIWTSFDLSKLGSVDFVDFELVSSKPDAPAYFCMDNRVAQIEIEY